MSSAGGYSRLKGKSLWSLMTRRGRSAMSAVMVSIGGRADMLRNTSETTLMTDAVEKGLVIIGEP
jgi:hypothetical protein